MRALFLQSRGRRFCGTTGLAEARGALHCMQVSASNRPQRHYRRSENLTDDCACAPSEVRLPSSFSRSSFRRLLLCKCGRNALRSPRRRLVAAAVPAQAAAEMAEASGVVPPEDSRHCHLGSWLLPP